MPDPMLSSARGAPPAAPAAGAFDAMLRRVVLVGYGVGIPAALAADLVGAWSPRERLGLLLSLVVVVASFGLVYRLPWHRAPRAPYVALHAMNLVLVAAALAMSGGWSSPFVAAVPIIVFFAAVTMERRVAFPIAALAALVSASPALYARDGQPLAVLITAAAVYAGIVGVVAALMESVRDRDRAVADAARARAQLEARAQGLIALQRVAAIVGGHLRLDDALDAIAREVGGVFGRRLVRVYLRDGEALVLRARRDTAARPDGVPDSIPERVAATGEMVFVPDVRGDRAPRPIERAVDAGEVIGELCVPLRDEGRVVGVLDVASVDAPLTPLDRELLELLAAQISVALRNARLAGELRRQADCDPLTGLLNHRAAMELLDGALATRGAPCAVIMLDVDRFKGVNDDHGHLAGDGILRRIAEDLRASCRPADMAARYGGDEFVVVLPGATPAMADGVLARVVQAVGDAPYTTTDGTVVPLAVSGGVAAAPADGATRRELLGAADAAMYAAKRARRAGIARPSPLRDITPDRLTDDRYGDAARHG